MFEQAKSKIESIDALLDNVLLNANLASLVSLRDKTDFSNFVLFRTRLLNAPDHTYHHVRGFEASRAYTEIISSYLQELDLAMGTSFNLTQPYPLQTPLVESLSTDPSIQVELTILGGGMYTYRKKLIYVEGTTNDKFEDIPDESDDIVRKLIPTLFQKEEFREFRLGGYMPAMLSSFRSGKRKWKDDGNYYSRAELAAMNEAMTRDGVKITSPLSTVLSAD